VCLNEVADKNKSKVAWLWGKCKGALEKLTKCIAKYGDFAFSGE